MQEKILRDTVTADISEFNATRGRRKALNPVLMDQPDYGRIHGTFVGTIRASEGTSVLDATRRVAHKVVPTLLRLKPRPPRIHIDIAEGLQHPEKHYVRLRIPKGPATAAGAPVTH